MNIIENFRVVLLRSFVCSDMEGDVFRFVNCIFLVHCFEIGLNRFIIIYGPLLQGKAEEFAYRLCETTLKCSLAQLDRFKDRHSITFKKVCGESRSKDAQSKDITEWVTDLKILLSGYNPKDTFNADETGLVFCLLPDKTLDFKLSSNKKMRYKQIENFHKNFQYTPSNLSDFVECSFFLQSP